MNINQISDFPKNKSKKKYASPSPDKDEDTISFLLSSFNEEKEEKIVDSNQKTKRVSNHEKGIIS